MLKKALAAAVVIAAGFAAQAPAQAAPISGIAPTVLNAETAEIQTVGYRRGFRRGYRRGFRRHGFHRGFRRGYRRGFHRYGYRRYRGCGWLHRKALHTGSAYWYRRYYDCRGWTWTPHAHSHHHH